MLNSSKYYIYFIIFLLYIIKNNKRNRKIGIMIAVISNGGLGNRIAGISGTFLLSILSDREFHSIKLFY